MSLRAAWLECLRLHWPWFVLANEVRGAYTALDAARIIWPHLFQ